MSHDDEELKVGSVERDRLHGLLGWLDDEDFARVDPPPELWGRMVRAFEAPQARSSATVVSEAGVAAVGGPPALAAPVASLDAHRARRHRRLVIASIAAALVLIGATGALLSREESPSGDGIVARATLEPLESIGASADVRLLRRDDHLQLVLDARDMTAAPPGQHYELWLLGAVEDEPVSLGPMTGSTSVPVPGGVDIDEYDVVDISLQETGQAEHSEHSLLRGTLT